MNDLLKRLAKARERHTEAAIDLRNLEYELEDAINAVQFLAGDYYSLGETTKARKIALENAINNDEVVARLRKDKLAAEARVDRAELALEQVLDERRYHENVTWARAVDALRGRVDHPGQGVAPMRAAEESVKAEVEETALDRMKRADTELNERWDNEIPF